MAVVGSAPAISRPTAPSERYAVLDLLRGLALFGVLIVNLLDFFRISLFEHILTFHTHPDTLNRSIDLVVAALLEFKAFDLFSWLFGIGIAIQAERGSPLFRRFLVLFALGLLHMFLLSNVDILVLYAVCGLLLAPFVRLSPPKLAILGLLAIAAGYFVPLPTNLPAAALLRAHAEEATRVYGRAGFSEILVFRWHETWTLILPLLAGVMPKTVGVMLFGMAAWRGGVLRNPERWRNWLLATVVVGGAVAIVSRGASGLRAHLPLAAAYAAAVLLWLNRVPPPPWMTAVAAAGRMALTNYLAQSLILGFVFYSYGLGLFGRLAPASALFIGIAVYAGQLLFSKLWLRRYRFGPLEWLWRSLTYGRWQP